jgi:hypothetical protein
MLNEFKISMKDKFKDEEIDNILYEFLLSYND